MGPHPIATLLGVAVVAASSACGPVTPSTQASPQSQVTTSTTSSASARPTTTTAARTGVYGDPAAAAKYWQQQSLEDNCGLVSVADVVGQITGHAPTEQQMIALAVSTPSAAMSDGSRATAARVCIATTAS